MTKAERNKLILSQYEKGYKQGEIATFYNLGQSMVSKIISSCKSGVKRELQKRGVKSKLNKGQLLKLAELLKKRPSEYGIERGCWDKWSGKELIKAEFNVDYNENYIWKIMKKIGYTSQLPQKKDYRQDSIAVEEFKKNKAATVKKKQKMNSGYLSSKTKVQ